MTPITLRSDILVMPVAACGGDWLVADTARVVKPGSANSGERPATQADAKLIHDLVTLRHGSPFQHGAMVFYVEAPIFVFREWRTHKVLMHQTVDDMGYNESSARYRPLRSEFWVPEPVRPIYKTEKYKPMRPTGAAASDHDYRLIVDEMTMEYQSQWDSYERMLAAGVLPEVARSVIGTGVYAAMYVTCNARSAMHFCSLRVNSPDSAVPTFPQAEIEVAARALEKVLSAGWPITHKEWVDNGRRSI